MYRLGDVLRHRVCETGRISMTIEEQKRLIQGLPFMSALPADAQQHVITAFIDTSELTRIEEGNELFREGDQTSNDGYVLLSGSIIVQKSYTNDAKAAAPALVGEVKQFNPKSERTATVRALEDLETLRFNWDAFYGALENCLHPQEIKMLRKALLDYAWQHILS